MKLRGVDRRGLPEIVAWSVLVVMTGLALVVSMFTHDASTPALVGAFMGAVTALIGRATKGAMDRDAADEASGTRNEAGRGG